MFLGVAPGSESLYRQATQSLGMFWVFLHEAPDGFAWDRQATRVCGPICVVSRGLT